MNSTGMFLFGFGPNSDGSYFAWAAVFCGVAQSLGTVRALGPGARRILGWACVWQNALG